MTLAIATSNPHKVREIQAILGRPLEQVSLDLPEIQAVEVSAVIRHKARQAFHAAGRAVLVEDTGLYFHAWNGLPGALIRWFMDSVGNEGLCRMLDGFADRRATARTCLGYFDGEEEHIFTGAIEGSIALHPRGASGFGWDAIFIPAGWDRTFGEGSAEEKHAISMRKLAVEGLRAHLDQLP
jgi:non-canonical purine NTP pyrophosphatase (RdgB/HAM1 family)